MGTTKTLWHVETYGPDGTYADPEQVIHHDCDSAVADIERRLGRPVPRTRDGLPNGDWLPDRDMSGPGIPKSARPVGAWHESAEHGCGGVALWMELVRD